MVVHHFSTNEGGYATIKDLSVGEPEHTDAYVKAGVYYVSSEKDSITVHLQYPFNEFYLDEYKAPKAENIYRASNRDTANTTYALVKIRKGDAVIENFFINEIPIGKLIKQPQGNHNLYKRTGCI
jgi:hypothetical protein